MHDYPSDITREEFDIIRSDLEKAKKATKPRRIDLYDIFCAVLYLIKNGCQWRMLPSDFPRWEIVRYYYDVWSRKRDDGSTLLDEVLRKIVVVIQNDDLRVCLQSFCGRRDESQTGH